MLQTKDPLKGDILVHETFIRLNLLNDYWTMLHARVQTSELTGSEEEEFLIFFYVFLCFKPRTLLGRAILNPETFLCTNFLKDHYTMLHTKYQSPGPSGFRPEDFLMLYFPYLLP